MPSLTISEIDALKFRKKLPSFDAQTRIIEIKRGTIEASEVLKNERGK
jgi:hypothetical protein